MLGIWVVLLVEFGDGVLLLIFAKADERGDAEDEEDFIVESHGKIDHPLAVTVQEKDVTYTANDQGVAPPDTEAFYDKYDPNGKDAHRTYQNERHIASDVHAWVAVGLEGHVQGTLAEVAVLLSEVFEGW